MSLKNIVLAEIKSILEQDVILQRPKDLSLGHFATPIAFSLAKKLKKSPMVIAEDLSNKLLKSNMFQTVEAIKGFINIKLSKDFFNSILNEYLQKDLDFAKANHQEKILLEFVSANPTGPLHIGHARGAILGDAL